MQKLSINVGCETMQGQELDPARMANADSSQQDNGMTLIAVLLCTLMRGTKLQEAKVRCRIFAMPVQCGASLVCLCDARRMQQMPCNKLIPALRMTSCA